MTESTLQHQLAAYKNQLDAGIKRYCDAWLASVQTGYTTYSHDAVEAYCAILSRGGKRMRGALVLSTYQMLGGENQQLALAMARIIEMAHAYLLIIDDVCDRSATRRGGPAAHRQLAEYHRHNQLHGDGEHFGESVAISAALAGLHTALADVGTLSTDDTTKLELLNNLNQNLIITTHGQLNDIFNEATRAVDEAEVLQMLSWKTSYYSFASPLQCGAILAKADVAEQASLHDYAMHIGLAFQIADDILGTFGDELKSGKSTQDDIKEGKMTLLTSRALARANPVQKQTLLAAVGNAELTEQEWEVARGIIQDTGALDYAQKQAQNHARLAAEALDVAPKHWSRDGRDFLRGLATYVAQRNE